MSEPINNQDVEDLRDLARRLDADADHWRARGTGELIFLAGHLANLAAYVRTLVPGAERQERPRRR